MKAELTLNEKSLLYGTLTTLAFLGIAATLYFSSSKQSAQTFAIILTALLIPGALIAGLMPYWCAEPSYDLSGAGVITTESENKAK
ncbi:MAG: hypothetical protein sL5_10720 [Candidatus Mesenet longicola]|uniref:Uncharacterized protein n=1 Tax=Candidatus Mesenet longicola TaxID=1892558 RepID=A0A8J3MMM1_9RICK|nr:MAG: hypothetical protein sGL2_11150 [Candidatus Mesenet longicola]GHM60079.1 MAG: hypothetical protein sL5_10720 [Candidatus Mesenet longicola]